MSGEITKPCTKAEAKALTERIRQSVDDLWILLEAASVRKAWKALGYDTFDDYVKAEFPFGTRRAYQLIDHAAVIREISAAAGADVNHGSQISERATREIKDDLPTVTTEIKARVEAGEKPQKAAADVIAEQREAKAKAKAEKAAQQAEWDRQQEEARKALPESIKRGEAAKAQNGSRTAAVTGVSPAARIAELEALNDALNAKVEEQGEYITSLESERDDMKRRLATFDDMAVQFEKGGFEAVIATKDERIRGLLRQVEDMSADRASLSKSRDFWKKTAIDLGYVSPNSQVEQEPAPVTEYQEFEDMGEGAPF